MAINSDDKNQDPSSTGDDRSSDDSEESDLSPKSDDKTILEIARKRFSLAEEAEAQIRQEALDDLRFRVGEQWPEQIKQSREVDRRPCLTINRLPQYIRQITNDQRQNPTAIKVNPVDDHASVDTAKVLQGLIRHIEYASNADVAYDTAFEGAVGRGLGYYRIVTDYADPNSFDQEIFIKRIRNSFSVFMDPNYQEPDGSDSNWGFVVDDMSAEDYKSQYPDSELSSLNEWESVGNASPGWATKSTCRVAEYIYKEFSKETLVQLSSGEVGLESALPKELPEGITIVNKRETLVPKIKWCKINAVEILEKTDWPGKWIPIIPVLGDELFVEGRRVLEGVIRHAKDPQRMYNYWASSETEMIALAPKAPFIGAEGQFEGHEEQWRTANTKNHAFLQYKPKALNGQPMPPPQRQVYEAPVQAITQARMQSNEDIKATTGIYDASLGNRSNENSGVAIQRRASQAQVSNFHFVDNLSRSIKHGGRILLDLIPKIYDTARAARILHDDGTPEMVVLNQMFQKDGKNMVHDLGSGKYDVTVATGPSYATKRQEAVASMLSLVQAYPAAAQVAGDLMVRNMDWPGAQEIADRLKKTLPPNLQENEKDGKQPQIPPQIQMQMQQMAEQNKALIQHLDAATDEIKNKKFELESRERIAMIQAETQLKIAYLKDHQSDSQLLLKTELEQLDKRLELLKVNEPIGTEQNPSAGGPMPMAQGNEPQAAPQGMPAQQPTGGLPPG